jgi:D-3-phosphoglycerate dehydrogenase
MPKILVADKITDGGLEILTSSGFEVDVKTGLSEDELVAIAPPYDGIIVRSGAKITKRVIEAADKVRVIGRAGVGVDNIDLDAATSRGVVVMNTPLGNITSAAEQALALMMSLVRHTPAADASMKAGEWNKKKFTGIELCGKTMGIVGLGKVGAIVARVSQALGMTVLVHDPFINPEKAKALDVELRDVDSLVKDADIISLHVPLTDQTRGLIGAERLAMMKKTTRLVNCARGGVVDEAALAEALRAGTIAGAALDVFETEPLPSDHYLRTQPNVILTPHLGASTTEAQEKVAEDLARQFADYFVKGEIKNPVNLAVTLKPHLSAFARLAETVGRFAAQTVRGGVARVECGCYGEIGRSGEDAHVLSVFALQGVLGTTVDTKVNLVNVGRIAESRGIEVNERRAEKARTYNNILAVKVNVGDAERTVSGTVFEGGETRIVGIDDFDIDVKPAPWMLLMMYPDMPGMVGKFGTVLGQANINIAGMSVGRRAKQGVAVVVLTVDDPVPDAVLDRLKESINAEQVHRIQL